jgi:hypothetical protein
MSEDQEERKLSISTTQVIASALAAMSVAFLTSWLGTTGTILGAFLGSVIATVGTATYTWSLHRTSAAVKHTAAQVRQTALQSNSLPRTVAQGPLRKPPDEQGEAPAPDSGQDRAGDSIGTPSAHGDETTVLTPAEQAAAEAEVDADAPTGRWDGFPWKKTLLATAAVLALSILGITVLEVVSGQSMASLSGHEDSKGTTVGNVVHHEEQDKTPAPSDQQTSTPEPGGGETQAPSPSETVAPSSEASPSSEPSPTTSPEDQPSSNASEAP